MRGTDAKQKLLKNASLKTPLLATPPFEHQPNQAHGLLACSEGVRSGHPAPLASDKEGRVSEYQGGTGGYERGIGTIGRGIKVGRRKDGGASGASTASSIDSGRKAYGFQSMGGVVSRGSGLAGVRSLVSRVSAGGSSAALEEV